MNLNIEELTLLLNREESVQRSKLDLDKELTEVYDALGFANSQIRSLEDKSSKDQYLITELKEQIRNADISVKVISASLEEKNNELAKWMRDSKKLLQENLDLKSKLSSQVNSEATKLLGGVPIATVHSPVIETQAD